VAMALQANLVPSQNKQRASGRLSCILPLASLPAYPFAQGGNSSTSEPCPPPLSRCGSTRSEVSW
jgi:hypothetical protein